MTRNAGAAGSEAYEAYVAVSVATLWREPGIHRELDRPALANPADPRGWLAAMTVEDKRGLVGKVETQVLFGQRVVVVERRGTWVRVVVPDQANPDEPRGYPGWLPEWQLVEDPAYGALLRAAAAGGPGTGTDAEAGSGPGAGNGPGAGAGQGAGGPRAGTRPVAPAAGTAAGASGLTRATPLPMSPRGLVSVRSLTAWLYHAPDPDGRFLELSFETRLPLLGEEGEWVAVAVPHGRPPAVAIAWLRRADVTVHPVRYGPGTGEVGGPTRARGARGVQGADLLATAREFLGLPYLWGGTSGFGVDCSGFVYLVHRAHGLLIPRDAGPQRDHGWGRPVEREELAPGDLVFFAHDRGRGPVHHVAMYAGDGRMIHAPNSERSVEEIPLDTPPYGEKYAGARRYHDG